MFESVKKIELFEKSNHDYPALFDMDLEENCYLDTVSVFTTQEGYSHYSIYTSMNGRDFDLLAEKKDDHICDFETGDRYLARGKEARIVRVYLAYNTASTKALLNRVEITGKKSGTEVQKCPTIQIPEFKDSHYNIEVTATDTYDAVYGIIERRLGKEYRDWFSLELSQNPRGNTYDFFELSYMDDKIWIKGNDGVSLAVGLNHYLKYYCKVSISQVGDQTNMPREIVALKHKVFRETKARVRYAYNYCTLSYSMAFWGENEWQDELDWLALNGVNVVLDLTAQEEVWRRFLLELNYTHEEIKRFIAGPAYYAWAYMANLSGFGGPVHDSWFADRTELARKNHLEMRKLGMSPVLQGYSGMVPSDICEHWENVDVIPQGMWCSIERPSMLRTTSPVFKEFADKFYKAQREVYGSHSIYFATDPFHEGGDVSDMQPREIAYGVLDAMVKNEKDAVWVIQSWQGNPSSELLRGIADVPNGKKHALILDLYAEKDPNYKKGHSQSWEYGYAKEFDETPWVFCMLNNFGGRLGLHGHLDYMAEGIPEAFHHSSKITGVGITPEASFNNPVLYDFLFDMIWCKDGDAKMEVIDLHPWVYNYIERRYGVVSESAQRAWDLMLETVYKGKFNMKGQGAPESIVNARPSLEIKSVSAWGNSEVDYNMEALEKAAKLLLVDYELLKDSKGYCYDLATVLQQVLSNQAYRRYGEMVDAYNKQDSVLFEQISNQFLEIAKLMDQVTGSCEYQLLGCWVEQAKDLAKNMDDFTKMLYELNAKAQITTWGSYMQSEAGKLHDYSNRQWSGLIGDFYIPRWEKWITAKKNELNGKEFEDDINWFEWEWQWVRDNKTYPNVASKEEFDKLAKTIFSL